MTMTLGDLLEMVRQDYVDHLLAAGEDARAEGAQVVFEPVLRDEVSGQPVLEGEMKLPARVDLGVTQGGGFEPVQVEAEGVFQYDGAVDVSWDGGMKVSVRPFRWDAMAVRLEGVADGVDWAPVQQWFWRWFAEPEELEGEVQEVVHHLSDPLRAGAAMRLVADMGSAPLEAWQDLLDACLACGAKRVEIGV